MNKLNFDDNSVIKITERPKEISIIDNNNRSNIECDALSFFFNSIINNMIIKKGDNEMSYRIYVSMGDREMQLFGNNEYPESFLKELENQGLKFSNEEYWFEKFKIKKLSPIIKSIDEYIIDTVEKMNDRYKQLNAISLKMLKREPKDSDYENSGFNKVLTTIASDCYPACNFTEEYKLGKTHGSVTSTMLDIVNYGYIFVGVNLLRFIGKENYHLEYDKSLNHFVYELNEGVELYFEGS